MVFLGGYHNRKRVLLSLNTYANLQRLSRGITKMDITKLLAFAIDNNASDLHLSAGVCPRIRVDGELRQVNLPLMTHQDIVERVYEVMNEQQKKEYEACLEIDFAIEIANLARFRVNVFNQIRGVGAVFRIIPSSIPSLESFNLPPIFKEIASLQNGLVLLTGPTGSGKSTTLAAIIDYINATRFQHILTIEDPVEFIHHSKNCLINQREVHQDTHSFARALRSALREDPDVIMVGELRNLETIRLAMTAAETGHLVFATLHTSSATKAINRMIEVFPASEKSVMRSMLSESLQAVVAQTLLKKNQGGRVAAFEIMIANAAIRNLIREDKIAQMYSSIQTGQALGMQTLDQHLTYLVNNNVIARHIARKAAIHKGSF